MYQEIEIKHLEAIVKTQPHRNKFLYLKSHGTRLRLQNKQGKVFFKICARLCVFSERSGEGKGVPVRVKS